MRVAELDRVVGVVDREDAGDQIGFRNHAIEKNQTKQQDKCGKANHWVYAIVNPRLRFLNTRACVFRTRLSHSAAARSEPVPVNWTLY